MEVFAGNRSSGQAGRVTPYRTAAVALCGVQFVDVLGVTVVITALPRMLTDLRATPAQGAWVVTAYALFFGGLLMVGSRLGDRLGHRRACISSLALFVAASALGLLAQSVWVLALARAVQGIAAAVSVPSALRLLTTLAPDDPARRRAVAGWSAAGAAAGACGFVVGGVFTELASWRAVFLLNIALAACLAGAMVRLIPRDQRHPAPAARMGWTSAIFLTGGAMGIVAGATLLGEKTSAGPACVLTAVGVLATAAFVLVERRARHPLVEPAARQSPKLRWGAFGSFFNTATTSSSITVATLYVQDDLGLTSLQTAGLLVTFSIFVVVGSSGAPQLIAGLGWHRALGFGLGIVACGNAALVAWPQVIGVGVAAGMSGFGIGIGSVAATDMGTAVGDAIKGTATGVLNTAAQLGTALGTALVLLLATATQPRLAWTVVAVFSGLAAVAAAARAPRQPSSGSGRAARERVSAGDSEESRATTRRR